MLNNNFEVIYFLCLFLGLFIRKKFVRNDRLTRREWIPPIIITAGMILIPLIYLLTNWLDLQWLDFADYFLPKWVGWVGFAIFVISLLLLWKSHIDLGPSFSTALEIKEEHKFVTQGMYSCIRHPIYTAFILWAIAQVLLLQNWIAGPAFLVVILPFYYYRIPKEEQMMLEQFGEEYRIYMKQTGKLFPHFRR